MYRDMIDEDIRRARTLPASFYRDPAVFERIREKVFAGSWQLVDGAEQVAGPGAVLPFTFLQGCLDEPLLLSRDGEGKSRTPSNSGMERKRPSSAKRRPWYRQRSDCATSGLVQSRLPRWVPNFEKP